MLRLRHVLGSASVVFLSVVLVAACGNSNSPSSPTPAPSPSSGGASSTADVTITIVGMNGGQSYSPNPATVKVGQTVSWRNADGVAHTATADGGGFNTGSIAPGATSAPILMATAGSLAYHCAFHPTMVATLAVQ